MDPERRQAPSAPCSIALKMYCKYMGAVDCMDRSNSYANIRMNTSVACLPHLDQSTARNHMPARIRHAFTVSPTG